MVHAGLDQFVSNAINIPLVLICGEYMYLNAALYANVVKN